MKRIWKKIITAVIVVALLLGITPAIGVVATTALKWTGERADSFSGGNGSQMDPYLISSAEELAYLAYIVNSGLAKEYAHYSLVSDIVLNSINAKITKDLDLDSCIQWEPIGTKDSPFYGNFQGNGHIIYGLVIDDSEKSYQGLFGAMNSSVLYDVHIRRSFIRAKNRVGSVVGHMNSVSDGVYYCSSDALVIATNYYAGGIGGYANAGYYRECYFFGCCEANNYVGGIAGFIDYATVFQCYNHGDVIADSSYAGGIVGYTDNSKIQYSYNIGPIMSGKATRYRIVGGSKSSSFLANYFIGETDSYATGLTWEEAKQKEAYNYWDFDMLWGINEDLNSGFPYLKSSGTNISGKKIYTTQEKYELITRNYPQYLKNNAVENFFSLALSYGWDVVEDYDNTDQTLLSFAESFVNGSEIILKEIFSGFGLGLSTEEEWLEKNTLEFMKLLQEDEDLIKERWKAIKDGYKDFEFVFDASEAIAKDRLILEILEADDSLTQSDVVKIVDKVYEHESFGSYDDFFGVTGKIVNGVDIVVYACQIYQLEKTAMERLLTLISKDSPLYEGASKILADIETSPGAYIVEKYLTSSAISFLSKNIEKAGNFVLTTTVNGVIKKQINFSITSTLVSLTAEFIYSHLYTGAKIDEVYGAIVAYDFYVTVLNGQNDLLLEFYNNNLSSTVNSAQTLSDYEFMFEMRRKAMEHYLDACINICKYSNEEAFLIDIKEDISNDNLIGFSPYIDLCWNVLFRDMQSGTVQCHHLEYSTCIVVPNCSRGGFTNYICGLCGYSWTSDYIDVTDHLYSIDEVQNATCIADGYTVYKCNTCSSKYEEKSSSALGHSYGDWIVITPGLPGTTGSQQQECSRCGDTIIEEIPAIKALSFSGATLTLENDLTVNYHVDKTLFTEVGYVPMYVTFVFNGVRTMVYDYTETDAHYVYSFKDLHPQQINDTIHATLYATYNGVEYASNIHEYSVKQYCLDALSEYAADEHDELRTLLVDLLNYGAKSQFYTGYRTDMLANADLTAEQLAWGTADTPAMTSVLNTSYEKIVSPSVKWKAAGLVLSEAIDIRLKIQAEDITGLTVKASTDAGQEWTLGEEAFSDDGNGQYYVRFSGLNASQLSEPVYFTVYDGDNAVSNTLRYSVESYASSKRNSTDTALAELVIAMMKYGNAAYNYIH